MRRISTKQLLTLTILVPILSSSFVSTVEAVFIADDTIYLKRGGENYTQNNVIVQDRNGSVSYYGSYYDDRNNWVYSPICNMGVCTISHDDYPVVIAVASQSDIMPYDEWEAEQYLNKEGCEGYVEFSEEIDSLLKEFSNSSEAESIREQELSNVNERGMPLEKASNIKEELMESKSVQYIRENGYSFYGTDACALEEGGYQIYLTQLLKSATNTVDFKPDAELMKSRAYKLDLETGEYKPSYFTNIANDARYVASLLVLIGVPIVFGISIVSFVIVTLRKDRETRYPKNS